MPASKKLQFEMYNGPARHFVHLQGDQTVYFWEVKNILPFKGEADMVDLSDVAPKLLHVDQSRLVRQIEMVLPGERGLRQFRLDAGDQG